MAWTMVSCADCGATMRRLGSPSPTALCAMCVDDGGAAMRESVHRASSARLEQRLGRFDGAGGFDGAELPAHPEKRWEKLAATAVAEHLRRLADAQPGRTGLVFIGPTGIGKTRAAIAMTRAVAAVEPAGVAAMTESDLLSPSVAPWELPTHVAQLLSNRHTIMIDEVGSVSRPADQIMAGWRTVVEYVHASPLPVLFIATTNRQSWSESGGLGEWMGAQSVSRLRECCEMATTGWTDHRINRDHLDWKNALLAGGRRGGDGA